MVNNKRWNKQQTWRWKKLHVSGDEAGLIEMGKKSTSTTKNGTKFTIQKLGNHVYHRWYKKRQYTLFYVLKLFVFALILTHKFYLTVCGSILLLLLNTTWYKVSFLFSSIHENSKRIYARSLIPKYLLFLILCYFPKG